MEINRSKHLLLDIMVAILFTVCVTGGIYYAAHTYVLDRAERNVQNLILSHRGLHQYIQRVMHPTFYQAVADGNIADTYYAPEIFSSSYVVRVMHGFYNEELQKHGRREIYYKLAAESPRNPVNQADQFELNLIKMFNERRELKDFRQIIKVDGKKYFYYAIPFLENTKACLRCHGKREDAPAGLLARYPGNGGFNEKIGHIRAIESIRAPLHRDFEMLYTTFAVVAAAAVSLLGLYLVSIRLRSEVQRKTGRLQEELTARKEAENELRIQAAMLEEEIAERQKTQEQLHLAKEAAETANRAKSAFLANMSHELRTPLNGVIGMAELLATTDTTDDQKSYLHLLKLSSDNLLAVISDILDITKIEADKIQLFNAEFSLRECLDEVVLLHRSHIDEKGLAITLNLPDAVPDRLIGDRLRLVQILSNLLSNAVKFTNQGTITITAAIKERHASTILLDISVADTGIGIDSKLIGYIFNMFTQADESYTRKQGGSGLGLAISRKLAELMGGSITVDSKPNHGSAFHLLLPCTTPSCPNGADRDRTVSVQPLTSDGQSLSILVAEDNPANLSYARKILESLGHQVTAATDGKQALAAWENGAFDLILMDIQMPEMNGDEVVKAIRRHERGERIPIIAVTAHAMIGDQERLLEAGCDGYVAKPFLIETLATEIRRVRASSGCDS